MKFWKGELENNKQSLSSLPETLIQVDKMGLAGNSGKQLYGEVKVGHKGETSGASRGSHCP